MNRAALDLVAKLAVAGVAVSVLTRPNSSPRARAALRPPRRQMLPGVPWHQTMRRLEAPARAAPLSWRDLLPSRPLRRTQDLTSSAGRRLNGSAAMLAFSVLADSAVEHYRGSFQNRAMYTPLVAATLTLGASLFGTADARPRRHAIRDAIYAIAAATGLTGLVFHCYNILKRPGRLSWLNLFYGAPIGAPMALALAGALGRGAERVRDTPARRRPAVLGLPAGRALAALSAAGIAGTVGEAALLHFRGAYHNPAMILPVTVPPVASVLLGAAALRPSHRAHRNARRWLRLTAILGCAGVGFHAFGVARNMGGWRNWSQNVLNGPPLPAPPSFTGLALAGLAALTLMEAETHG